MRFKSSWKRLAVALLLAINVTALSPTTLRAQTGVETVQQLQEQLKEQLKQTSEQQQLKALLQPQPQQPVPPASLLAEQLAIALSTLLVSASGLFAATGVGSPVWADISAWQSETTITLGDKLYGLRASEAMSCPVFVGSGTLLGEDRCVWSTVSGERTNTFSRDTETVTWRVGGQTEVSPGWYLGGTLAAGTGWQPAIDGVGVRNQDFNASVALKKVAGPWLLAGSLDFTSNWNHTTRLNTIGASSVVQGDQTVYKAIAGIRAAYDVALGGWYVRPRADLLFGYIAAPGSQENGSGVTLAIQGTDRVKVALMPVVEVGGRIDLGETTILRPYVAGGATFLPDNAWTVTAGFGGALAALGTYSQTYTGATVLGTVEAGLQLYDVHGIEFRATYKLAAGDSFLSQIASLRLGWHF